MSLDLANDTWLLYINGKTNLTYTYNKSRKLNEKFSDRADLPMVMRLGHYYFDNKPLLGTMQLFKVFNMPSRLTVDGRPTLISCCGEFFSDNKASCAMAYPTLNKNFTHYIKCGLRPN